MFDMTIVDSRSGERFEVKVTSRDLLMWEKVTQGANLKQFEATPRVGDMHTMAYFAAKRLGVIQGMGQKDFDLMFDVDFDAMSGEDADEDSEGSADPTGGEVGTDS